MSIKSFSEIYDGIKQKFFNKSKLDIEPGTVIDCFVLSAAESIHEARVEIEESKNPHIYTKLSGEYLDSTGFFVNCPREANESDESYKYRFLNWMLISEASNETAIEMALMNMDYASYVTYVPYTEGVGTATAYIIPKTYDDTTIDNAIAETEARLKNVVSPGSYISYIIPNSLPVDIVAYIGIEDGDLELIKENIKTKIAEYVNKIPVGEFLEIGEISKIGINEPNVNYFSITQFSIDNKVTAALNILQRIESKFLFNKITWWTAVK